MIVGFTGSSTARGTAQLDCLRQSLRAINASEVHHGDCVGADAQFDEIARALGLPVIIHPPADEYKRAFCNTRTGFSKVLTPLPFLERNREIVNASTILIACPKGFEEEQRSGTWATVRYTRKQRKYILMIWPDGTLTKSVERGFGVVTR